MRVAVESSRRLWIGQVVDYVPLLGPPVMVRAYGVVVGEVFIGRLRPESWRR